MKKLTGRIAYCAGTIDEREHIGWLLRDDPAYNRQPGALAQPLTLSHSGKF